MEQESIVREVKTTAKITGEYLIKVLVFMTKEGKELYQNHKKNATLTGETTFKKMLSTSDKKDMKTFLATEINLDKLKIELEKYQVGFAFTENPKTKEVSLLFNAKDENIISQAFSNVIQDIAQNPKKAIEKLDKNSLKNQSVKDKLAYFKKSKKTTKNIKDKLAEKKGKTR